MGGSQSREDDERAAVVKRVENKDGQVTVEISEELVKDIHEKYAAGPGEEIVAPSGGHQDPPVVHSESSPSTNHLLLELEREKLKVSTGHSHISRLLLGCRLTLPSPLTGWQCGCSMTQVPYM
jgi:hypothetical protein